MTVPDEGFPCRSGLQRKSVCHDFSYTFSECCRVLSTAAREKLRAIINFLLFCCMALSDSALNRGLNSSNGRCNTVQKLFFIFLIIIPVISLADAATSAEQSMSYHYAKSGNNRIVAPNFDLPPDAISQTDQASLIGEYQRRGYDLNCYGDLRPEEKISKIDDYECWTLVESAYDNIPAKMVVFFFSKGELNHVRIEFPESSFDNLQDYLKRRLANYPRLDKKRRNNFGTDIYGKPLMVWKVKEGVVITSASATLGRPVILLWSKTKKR